MKRAVAALGAQEIESIVEEQGKIEVLHLPVCHGLQNAVHCAVLATRGSKRNLRGEWGLEYEGGQV